MFVRDIMASNLVTVPGDTYVLDAERIMESHKIARLPVVEKGKLIGIVTKDDILKASPSSTTPFNQRQLFYLMSKLTVKEIMKTKVVTVTPDTTVERAVAIAQKNRVGSLPVVKGDKIVGIITTNDVFYKILNPLFGIGEGGTRIIIAGAVKQGKTSTVMEYLQGKGYRVKAFWVPPDGRLNLVLHLDTSDVSQIVADLAGMGLAVETREFKTP